MYSSLVLNGMYANTLISKNVNRNLIFVGGKERSIKTQALTDLRYVQCQYASRMYETQIEICTSCQSLS